MPKSIDTLSLDEALSVLSCNSARQCRSLFGSEYKNLIREAPVNPNYKLKNYTYSKALMSLITAEPSLAMMLIWGIVGSVTIAIPSLAIICLFSLGIFAISGLIYFIITLQEEKRKQASTQDFFQISALKDKCADLVMQKYEQEIPNIRRLIPRSYARNNYEDDEPVSSPLKPATGITLLVSTTLFGTYYIGASALIAAFGLTASFAFLTGPIAIGVCLGVALGIGLYFGYAHYRNLQNKTQTQTWRKEVTENLTLKQQACDNMQLVASLTRRNSPQEVYLPRAKPPLFTRSPNEVQSPANCYGTFGRRLRSSL